MVSYWLNAVFAAVLANTPAEKAKTEGLEQDNYNKVITSTAAERISSSYSDVAVLLIDMQKDFLQNIDWKERKREQPNILEVLAQAGNYHTPVVVLEYNGHRQTIEVLKRKIISLPTDIRYIVKSGDDGFYQTSLSAHLKQIGVKDIILMGINATGCVKTTAVGALENGFGIITSRDVIAQPSSWVDDEKYEGAEGSRWFQRKGRLADNYRDLLKIISESSPQKLKELNSTRNKLREYEQSRP